MKNRPTIALLTDFGLQDNYVGIMNGVILNINPDVQIVDITHEIPAQDILQGALALKSAYSYFPHGTIFVGVVDPGVGSKRKPILVVTKQYYFLGPDNGLLSPIIEEEKSVKIFSITSEKYFLKPVSNTFHGRDIFAPVAAHLSKGLAPARFGKVQKDFVRLKIPRPTVQDRHIIGEVIAIDRFGNLITNIEEKLFNGFKGKFQVKIKNVLIKGLSPSYFSVKAGEPLVVIGSKGYLEISVNQGSAKECLKAGLGDKVNIVTTAKP